MESQGLLIIHICSPALCALLRTQGALVFCQASPEAVPGSPPSRPTWRWLRPPPRSAPPGRQRQWEPTSPQPPGSPQRGLESRSGRVVGRCLPCTQGCLDSRLRQSRSTRASSPTCRRTSGEPDRGLQGRGRNSQALKAGTPSDSVPVLPHHLPLRPGAGSLLALPPLAFQGSRLQPLFLPLRACG